MLNLLKPALLLTLAFAFSVSAQDISQTFSTHIDTLKNGATVEYIKDDSTAFVKTNLYKPRTKLWHPVVTGLETMAIGLGMFIVGYVVAPPKPYETSPSEFSGQALAVLGGVLMLGGEFYAIIGGIYNATIPDDPSQKSAARQFNISPTLSFSQSGKPQPGMLAWLKF